MSERHPSYPAGTGEAPGTMGGFRPATNGHRAEDVKRKGSWLAGKGARPPRDGSGDATDLAGMT